MRTALRILRWVGIVLLAVVLVGGGGGYLWLRGALPQTSGTIRLAGLAGSVEVVRDQDGVPHIRAESSQDALFGLGYVHAQERLWQMEFQRRVGNAQLSEVLGERTLPTDRFLRTLGVARAAASAWQTLDADTRSHVEAYVAGVNAFISTHRGNQLPVEFTILGFAPAPWRPEDVLVWAKMMSYDLGGNWSDELLRRLLEARVGANGADQLTPAYTADGPIILPNGVAGVETVAARPGSAATAIDLALADDLLAIHAELQARLDLNTGFAGSNNWVVSGARSTTGKPLLANDPHLGARIPSIWFLAHITGGDIDAIGATLPGVPGVVIGHNGRIAWGVTNTGPDVQDLFIEQVNARNQVLYQGRWEPMQIVNEVIKVQGQPDEHLVVRITRHGPLISDVRDNEPDALAMRWTSLDAQDTTIAAFLQINRAQNWAEFTRALALYHAPMQNFVYADVDGNIGYYAPGALPIRASGDGRAPVPGWTGEHDWTGYVPFEQLPHVYNPPEGYIVTANNQVAPDSYPYQISSAWAAPYRAARIVELIEAQPQLSPDAMAAIQADVVSAQARSLLPYLLEVPPQDDLSRQAIERLRGWDGSMAGESSAAAIYQAWWLEIAHQLYGDELGPQLWERYADSRNWHAMAVLEAVAGGDSAWCDVVGTPAAERCPDVLALALRDGLEKMARLQGSTSLDNWRWDRVHRAVFAHNVLDGVGALKPIFSRSIPNGGDGFTVNVAPVRRTDLYNQYHVPSYRHIIDLANLDGSRFNQTVGQSGSVLSGEYSNLLTAWQQVEYLPMRFSREAVEAGARQRLTLSP